MTIRELKSRAGLLRYRTASRISRWWVTELPRRRTRQPLTFWELMELSRTNRREAYAAALHEYRSRVPPLIREHRSYFGSSRRGYGEDAFHGAWWLLFRDLRPQLALEIGVFRGQSISLWTMCARELSFACAVHGISPLEAVNDAFSSHPEGIDYESDIRDSFERFGLRQPVLVRALSTDPEAVAHMRSHSWDLIYVDGSHDYAAVKSDLRLASETVRPGGLVVADDAALFLGRPLFHGAFMGIEDPSRAVAEIPPTELHRIGAIGHMVFLEKPINSSPHVRQSPIA